MAKVTSAQFVELAHKSQLAEADAIDGLVASIKADYGGELPENADDVAKEFKKAGLLTQWHCEKMLQGKYRGFFLGKHKLLGHLGSGGMSTVYLAEHLVMHHKRAVKVLPKSKLGKNSYLLRFQQEAKAIAALNHPNIVRAFDIDNENDTHYIVMEYVDGLDIQSLVKKHGPLSFDQVADFTLQSAAGLQHAHDRGLIHRDVKPANLLVNSQGVVKVLDLGLALFADEEQASLTMEHNDKVLGTADYLAPEQAINSHNIDFRADIYSLGCSMYFMLTGKPPFPEGSIAQRIAKHQKVMPDDIRKKRPDCPGELDGICVKMMQKDPRFRYADCNQIVEVLQRWLANYRKNVVPAKASIGSLEVGGGTAVLTRMGDSSKSFAPADNQSGKNLAGGKSGKIGPITSLSSGDSGVLRKMAEASGSFVNSQIDLEFDTDFPIAHRRKNVTPQEREVKQVESLQRTSQIAQANAKKTQAEKERATQRTQPMRTINSAKVAKASTPWGLIISMFAILLVAAAVLGFFVARWVG
jgi:eukaryotic-like serine/threonine-protein kinase